MRKVKLLIAVLVCSVMMMGVGYAWWSDSITMATTAKTGDLDVDFVEGGVRDKSGENIVEGKVRKSITKPDYIYCELDKLYPGAKVIVDVTVKNTGDLPVKLKSITFSDKNTESRYLDSQIDCEIVESYDKLGVGEQKTYKVCVTVKEDANDFYQSKTANFNIHFNWGQWNETN